MWSWASGPTGGLVLHEGWAYFAMESTRVTRASIETGVVESFAGSLDESCGIGTVLDARFDGIRDLAWVGDTLIVADVHCWALRAISSGTVSTVGVVASHPYGLSTLDEDHILVADIHEHRINRVNIVSGVSEHIAGTGAPASGPPEDDGDGGPPLEARFLTPYRVAVGPDSRPPDMGAS